VSTTDHVPPGYRGDEGETVPGVGLLGTTSARVRGFPRQTVCPWTGPRRTWGNRTGRAFTGDRSGDWLYEALFRFGFANQAESTHLDDGLQLKDCYVAAAVRCAPPENKPTKEEFETCRPYLVEELRLLKRVTVVVALGKIAFDEYLKASTALGHTIGSPTPKFGHGSVHVTPWGTTLLGCFHPSQRNTFTGRLSRPMFYGVFQHARRLLDGPEPTLG